MVKCLVFRGRKIPQSDDTRRITVQKSKEKTAEMAVNFQEV